MGVTGFKMQNRVKHLINASNSSEGYWGITLNHAMRQTVNLPAKIKAPHGMCGYAYRKRRINHDTEGSS